MAVTDRINNALAVLTSAALSLPGLSAKAALPASNASANFLFGDYRESDDRMKAQVFHADVLFPMRERVDFTFKANEDVYSGATPLFSVPNAMRDKPKRILGTNIYEPADVVVSASPVVGTFEVTTSMHGFKSFEDGVFDYILNTPPALQTVEGGLAAGYTEVIDEMVPDEGDISQTFVDHPQEARKEGVLGLNYYFDDVTLAVSGGVSDEPDYKSSFGSTNVSWELGDDLTTLNFGYGLTSNEISRVESHGSGGDHVHAGDEDYQDLDEDSTYHSFNFGLSRVLTKNTLLQLNASYTHQRGYLTNPYKLVYVRGEITPDEYAALNLQQAIFQDVTDLEVAGVELFREVRPDRRNRYAVSTQLRHYFPALDSSLHLDYRYYWDNWNIDSHTLETSWYQELSRGVTVTPYVRYYSQSEAYFYAPYFLAPRSDGYYSSDYRLSAFGALSTGLNLRKEFDRGFALQAGIDYRTQKGSLKLGGGGIGDYADFHSYLLHASLELDLESRFSSSGYSAAGHHGHHVKASHPVQPPAGLMFGQMMNRAGDLMVGYQYMYGRLDGDMYRGTRKANDREVIDQGCRNLGCTNTSRQMEMHMNMLHLMYAPTDWLNLAVMPTLINKKMRMRSLEGAPDNDSHSNRHDSDGIGDTLLAALTQLYDSPGHHLHLGLGLSAPTGSINSKLYDSELQGYGMQLGSGTWDFIPSLTYTGQASRWSWGAQIRGTKRLEDENGQHYRFGDEWQVSTWGGFRISPWLSASVRGIFTDRGEIHGETDRHNSQSTPVDFPENYGGQFWDLGLGVNLAVPDGAFSGHGLKLEWLEPIRQDNNGYQLDREGTLYASWSYHF